MASIYEWCEPDGINVRYVGQTTQEPAARLQNYRRWIRTSHRLGHRWRRIHYWLKEHERAGTKPIFRVVRRNVPDAGRFRVEQEHINQRVVEGHSLLNKQGL
jgi:hypothetical protein